MPIGKRKAFNWKTNNFKSPSISLEPVGNFRDLKGRPTFSNDHGRTQNSKSIENWFSWNRLIRSEPNETPWRAGQKQPPMDGPMECRIYVEHGTLGPKFWSLQFSIVKGDETGWRRWRRWPWRRYTGGTFNRPNFICFHTHLAHSLFFPLFSIIYSFFVCVCVVFLLIISSTVHSSHNQLNKRNEYQIKMPIAGFWLT